MFLFSMFVALVLRGDDHTNLFFLRPSQEKKFLLQNKMDELKDKGKSLVETFDEKRHDIIQKWENTSRDLINNFIEMFGPDGTLVRHYLCKQKIDGNNFVPFDLEPHLEQPNQACLIASTIATRKSDARSPGQLERTDRGG